MNSTVATVATSPMSSSLLARDVYCVCFTPRDSMEVLQGEFAQARRKYFYEGKRTVKVGRHEIVKGFEGRLRGKLSRRGLYWKKTANGLSGTKSVVLEEAFDQRAGYLMLVRDFRSVIVSRVFFDHSHIWIKSEYYEPWDSGNARVIFKPIDSSDTVERFDWDSENKRYRSTVLYPAPYLSGTAEQSIINARFGEPQLLISTAEGVFCYCPEKEAKARKQALGEINNGTIVLMPAWEVKDGALTGETGEEDTGIAFTSLEEYARIQPPQEEPEQQEIYSDSSAEEEVKTSAEEGIGPREPEEFTPPAEVAESSQPDDAAILAAAKKAAGSLPSQEHTAKPNDTAEPQGDMEDRQDASPAAKVQESTESLSPPSAGGYVGTIVDGKITGRGRTQQPGGLTAYDGEYLDGKRDGFGSYYYKDGNLCYAGFWEDDKKHGLGVSFRDSDHALHIANWTKGEPGGFVSLFDKEGNLRYGGRIENGKKDGVGVSYGKDDGSLFVGKWKNGENTNIGSAFDREGNLLYYGSWKDGKRNGHGTEFDKNGAIIFDGEWKDDKYHNGILYQKQAQDGLQDTDISSPDWDI